MRTFSSSKLKIFPVSSLSSLPAQFLPMPCSSLRFFYISTLNSFSLSLLASPIRQTQKHSSKHTSLSHAAILHTSFIPLPLFCPSSFSLFLVSHFYITFLSIWRIIWYLSGFLSFSICWFSFNLDSSLFLLYAPKTHS